MGYLLLARMLLLSQEANEAELEDSERERDILALTVLDLTDALRCGIFPEYAYDLPRRVVGGWKEWEA